MTRHGDPPSDDTPATQADGEDTRRELGLEPGATLAGTGVAWPPTIADGQAPPPEHARPPSELGVNARYQVGAILGRGGMGEVLSARDEQIGRAVAIKRLRIESPTPEVLARFLREARIQGRLEHPAIVPVHELSHEPGEEPFFVMRRLTGTTLGDVLALLAAGDPKATLLFGRKRLLRAFVDVCLAIEYAHTRGVVHRDLKPANIVLGDFGEVYVLDWGIAKIEEEVAGRASFSDIDTIEETPNTVVGSILGTPGYIAPEQIRGDVDLDGRADVYALGCILFEVLAHEPLHPRGQGALATALSGVDARPSMRAPTRDLPPELDAICVAATAAERGARFPTARALGDAVQRYLDGDRDVELRRQLARAELAAARGALAIGDGDDQRRFAMRAAARALALDPTDREPADLVGLLMLEPPREVPREVDVELERLDLESLRGSARFGALAALAYLFFFPILYWIGYRENWYLVAGPAICAFIIYVEVVVAQKNPYLSGYLAIGGHLVMFVLLSRIVTPVVLGAGPGVIMVMLLATHPRLIPTWLLAGIAAAATMMPWFLEWLGVMPSTISVSGRTILLHTAAGTLDHVATIVGLILYILGLLALATVLSTSQDGERRAVRRTLQIQAWQLKQLVPRPSSDPPGLRSVLPKPSVRAT